MMHIAFTEQLNLQVHADCYEAEPCSQLRRSNCEEM